ncbi:porin [Stenoxybacter acetivorans]|uniref:porin n=1 Tax=Stenoxybacter acetivorans TaxID=422441 RepID=UPI000563D446|nr:porin [Stenoxybacter acetivorans]
MKKTLIALALTTLPVAAMAEVTLYGQIKAGYEASSTKISGIKDVKDWGSGVENGIADYGSRIGFKGKEDLGNGLNAIWQVESKVGLADGKTNTKNQFATRDSFIGLETPFGKIRAGYLSNYSNSDMEQVDPWEYNNSVLGLGTFTRFDTRFAGVRYDSPEFAGFSASLLYSPSDNNKGLATDATGTYYGGTDSRDDAAARPAVADKKSKDTYNVGLSYENAGFFGKYSYEYHKNSAGTFNGQLHRLEAGYDANNLLVAVGYQNAKNLLGYNDKADAFYIVNYGGSPVRTQEAVITAGYHFGNVFPKISYAHGWDVKSAGTGKSEKSANTKYDQIVLGADYSFSKRTTANVQAGWLREGRGLDYLGESKGKQTTTAFGAGLKHVF